MSRIDTSLIEPGQELEIAVMRPQDAPGVAALFETVYGRHYPVKTYYDPQALREANRQGDIISAVARTPKGDVVGHNAFYRIAPYSKVYEGGAGLVLASYRNTAKILNRMVAAGIKAVPDFGGEGIYGEHACNHVYTQKVAIALGNTIMGLEVDLMPSEAYQKEKSSPGRVSSLFGFQTIKPFPHTVYLPPAYQEFMRFLYEGLDQPRKLATGSPEPPQGEPCRVSGDIHDYAGVTRIAVSHIGPDFTDALAEWEAKAAARGVVVYQVWLPLSRPCVGWAVEVLRERGYFLGGLLPRWFDQDGMLMQRLALSPDWDAQQILEERSKIITRYIKEDWQRAGGLI